MSSLTLEQAAKITDAALAEGARRKFAPLCVVVLDPGGHALVLKRMEKASISRPQIAMAKAAGCLGMGFGGRELARRADAVPAFFTALARQPGRVQSRFFAPASGTDICGNHRLRRQADCEGQLGSLSLTGTSACRPGLHRSRARAGLPRQGLLPRTSRDDAG